MWKVKRIPFFPFVGVFLALVSSMARAETYMPSPDLMGSPALLQDYVSWDKAYTAFYSPGSDSRAYVDLLDIIYDREISRPWGEAYFPEAGQRLQNFRSFLCPSLPSPQPRLCTIPAKMASDQDVTDLAKGLEDKALTQALEKRWGIEIDPVTLPNASHALNFEVGYGAKTSETASFWDLSPASLSWFTMIPIVTDADTYRAGFEGDDFPSQFALSGDSVVLNDWQVRDRSMVFASHWKFNVDFNKKYPPKDPAAESEELLYQALYDENQDRFQSVYAQLLPKAQGNEDVLARFLKEKSQNDYPEEVFQYVAYSMLSELVRVQGDYYGLADKQRRHTSARQKSLESLLTLQRYASSWRMFLVDWETLAMPFTSHSAVLDQTTDFATATAFSLEQLNLILGLDVYAKTDYFARYRYAILADELFNEDYLKANQPDIYRELLQPDGTLKRVTDLGDADQLRFLRQYLTTTDGQPNEFGISRMSSVFRVRVREKDLREIADIIHAARSGGFRP